MHLKILGKNMRLNTTKLVLVALSTLALFAFATSAKAAPPVEIRFCPVAGVWTYPLESRRELQSLLLQNVAVVNHGKTAFDVKAIELELLQAGQILDTRGVSYVGWGASFHTGHRWAIPEEFALDIAK